MVGHPHGPGAGKGRVIFLVLQEMGLMVAAGMALGALLIAFLTRFVASRLYGLSALDPLTIFLAALYLDRGGRSRRLRSRLARRASEPDERPAV
jgi:hypothetical protein